MNKKKRNSLNLLLIHIAAKGKKITKIGDAWGGRRSSYLVGFGILYYVEDSLNYIFYISITYQHSFVVGHK